MSTKLNVVVEVDTDSERQIYAYGGKVVGEMFVLVVFRCPACGTTGTAESWCEGHSAPREMAGEALRVKREPVLVPHADPERTTAEPYGWSEP
jgi:hypothetical protein